MYVLNVHVLCAFVCVCVCLCVWYSWQVLSSALSRSYKDQCALTQVCGCHGGSVSVYVRVRVSVCVSVSVSIQLRESIHAYVCVHMSVSLSVVYTGPYVCVFVCGLYRSIYVCVCVCVCVCMYIYIYIYIYAYTRLDSHQYTGAPK
jgi:hypothetical protein